MHTYLPILSTHTSIHALYTRAHPSLASAPPGALPCPGTHLESFSSRKPRRSQGQKSKKPPTQARPGCAGTTSPTLFLKGVVTRAKAARRRSSNETFDPQGGEQGGSRAEQRQDRTPNWGGVGTPSNDGALEGVQKRSLPVQPVPPRRIRPTVKREAQAFPGSKAPLRQHPIWAA